MAKTLLRLFRNYMYDCRRYARSSSALVGDADRERLEARITINYHRIEKGLALPQPRPGFGLQHIDAMIRDVETYRERYGWSDLLDIVLSCLMAYQRFSHANDLQFPDVDGIIARYRELSVADAGATVRIKKSRIDEATRSVQDAFFTSRHSVRQIENGQIADADLDRAVFLAQHAPSVCNRQSGRVRIVSGPAMEACLALQNGNRGFGDTFARVAIVTSDLRTFVSVGERNQCWIDGGLFAMAFCYALHAQGLGTCMLNWSVEKSVDSRLREVAGVADHEAVIMMMGIGLLPDEFEVARSKRAALEDVRTFIR